MSFQFFSVTYDKGRDKHRKDKLISLLLLTRLRGLQKNKGVKMQKIINITTISSESYFSGWREIVEVSSLYGEKFNLTSEWQPGQLYSGYSRHGIPTVVSRPLALWLARQEWAMSGHLELDGDQLMLVEPNTSFWYPQPDTRYAIAKIV